MPMAETPRDSLQVAPKGLIIAGTASGSGKTVTTCGLIGALRKAGHSVAAAKCGPDYIDPAFLSAAAGRSAINLDPWAMSDDRLVALAGEIAKDNKILVVEGVMGLFDGAVGGAGSTAELACKTGLPIALVLPATGTAQSVAATADGFATMAAAMGIKVAGALVTRIASPRHAALIREGFERCSVQLMGTIPSCAELQLPSRHLGLFQACENPALDAVMETAADLVASHTDVAALIGRLSPLSTGGQPAAHQSLPPPGQRIAIASDQAFAFVYEHWLDDFRRAGAEVLFFSPLANEPPPDSADAIILPGGYPELHGAVLAAADRFRTGLAEAAARNIPVYGECGGYMALGEAIIDADGRPHQMSDLLPLVTDFSKPKLHLGYRKLSADMRFFWPGVLCAHEFHYSVSRQQGDAESLFFAHNIDGTDIGPMGMRRGSVAGSFAHIIDRVADDVRPG